MQFESEKITLPNGREYHVPALPEGVSGPQQISPDFFLQRVEIAYKAMRRVVEELTRKGHNQSKGSDELEKLEKLKGEVRALIATYDPVASIGALNHFCGELHSGPVRRYKSNPQQQKVFKILLSQILDAERKAIETVFNLPQKFRSVNGEPAKEAPSVSVQPHPDEVQADTVEALQKRIEKNPNHYLAMEKMQTVLRKDFGAIIADLERVKEIQIGLKGKLGIIRGTEGQVKMAIEIVKGEAGEIENTLKVVPTPNTLKGLPAVLSDATNQVYGKWIGSLLSIARYQTAGSDMKEGIDQFRREQDSLLQTIINGHDFIEKFSEAKVIFSHEFLRFHQLEACLKKLAEEVVNASDAVSQSKKALSGLLKNKRVRKLLPRVLPFIDDGEQTIIKRLFQFDQEELDGKVRKGAVKKEPTDKKTRRPVFLLKNKSLEEIRDEAIRRMSVVDPQVAELYKKGEIDKLMELCTGLSVRTMMTMGINGSWFSRFDLDMNKIHEERVKLFNLLFQDTAGTSA